MSCHPRSVTDTVNYRHVTMTPLINAQRHTARLSAVGTGSYSITAVTIKVTIMPSICQIDGYCREVRAAAVIRRSLYLVTYKCLFPATCHTMAAL